MYVGATVRRTEVTHLLSWLEAAKTNDENVLSAEAAKTWIEHATRNQAILEGHQGWLKDLHQKLDEAKIDWPLNIDIIEDEELAGSLSWYSERIRKSKESVAELREYDQTDEVRSVIYRLRVELKTYSRIRAYFITQLRDFDTESFLMVHIAESAKADIMIRETERADQALLEAKNALDVELVARSEKASGYPRRKRHAYVKHLHKGLAAQRKIFYEARMKLENLNDYRNPWESCRGLETVRPRVEEPSILPSDNSSECDEEDDDAAV